MLDLRVRDAVVARQLGLNLADLVESVVDGRVRDAVRVCQRHESLFLRSFSARSKPILNSYRNTTIQRQANSLSSDRWKAVVYGW